MVGQKSLCFKRLLGNSLSFAKEPQNKKRCTSTRFKKQLNQIMLISYYMNNTMLETVKDKKETKVMAINSTELMI